MFIWACGDLGGLLLHGLDDLGVAVPGVDDGDAHHEVQPLAAVGPVDPAAFGVVDGDRRHRGHEAGHVLHVGGRVGHGWDIEQTSSATVRDDEDGGVSWRTASAMAQDATLAQHGRPAAYNLTYVGCVRRDRFLGQPVQGFRFDERLLKGRDLLRISQRSIRNAGAVLSQEPDSGLAQEVARLSLYRRLLASLRARRRDAHLLAPARPPRRRQRRPGASRPHGHRLLGQSQPGLRGRATCLDSIGNFLDGPIRQEVALVGVGNLGSAVLAHFAEAEPVGGASWPPSTAIPRCTARSVHGVRIFDASRMERIVRDLGIEIAVLTVPARAPRTRPTPWCGRACEPGGLHRRAAARARRRLRRVHGHHLRPGVGGVLRPPRAARRGGTATRTARRDRTDGQDNRDAPCGRDMKLEELAGRASAPAY